MQDKMLNINQIAEITGVERSSVYKDVRTGKFPKICKIATKKLVPKSVVFEHYGMCGDFSNVVKDRMIKSGLITS